MSLNWNVAKVVNKDEVCWHVAPKDDPMRGIKKGSTYLRPTTEAIIMYTMATGIPRITQDNWKEFYVRVRFLSALHGPIVCDAKGNDLITSDVVRAHVGLSTNASRMTRNQFTKVKVDGWLNDRMWSLNAALDSTK